MTLRHFADFHEGDTAWTVRRFTEADYQAFRALSGDANRLHHDAAYAATTAPGRPIQPLHLTMLPLSALAGMCFPGLPSLYLRQDVRAVAPVFYGDEITYSARISALQPATRVLTLEVRGLRLTPRPEVVLEARLEIACTAESWEADPAPGFTVPAPGRPRALITGAAGDVGQAIAAALAPTWDLVLVARTADARLAQVVAAAQRRGAQVATCIADLTTPAGRQTAAQAAATADLVVHAACPPLDAPLASLVAVQVEALQALADAALPHQLVRQRGTVVQIGSLAVRAHPRGWEAYTAAKAAADSLMAGGDRRWATHGVRHLVLAPGAIQGAFSAGKVSGPLLQPAEVADALLALLADPAPAAWTALDPVVPFLGTPASSPASHEPARAPALPGGDPLADTVRRVLRLPASADLSQAGLGVTPGWDSLRHLELVLALERTTGRRLAATDLTTTHTYAGLVRCFAP